MSSPLGALVESLKKDGVEIGITAERLLTDIGLIQIRAAQNAMLGIDPGLTQQSIAAAVKNIAGGLEQATVRTFTGALSTLLEQAVKDAGTSLENLLLDLADD